MTLKIPRDEEWTLETDQLLLSPISARDAEPLFELLKEPALHSFTGGAPPSALQVLERRISLWEHRQSPEGDEVWLNWTLRRKADRVVVGYLQVTIRASQAELAWVIGIPFQGRGYAKEASRRVVGWLRERLEIGELRANIHPKHAASQAVAKHIGLHPSPEITAEGEVVWVSSH